MTIFICGMEWGGCGQLPGKGAQDFSGCSMAPLGTAVFSDSIRTFTDVSYGHIRVPTMGQVVGDKRLEAIPFTKGFLTCTEDQHKSSHCRGFMSPKWFYLFIARSQITLRELIGMTRLARQSNISRAYFFFLKHYQSMTFQSLETTDTYILLKSKLCHFYLCFFRECSNTNTFAHVGKRISQKRIRGSRRWRPGSAGSPLWITFCPWPRLTSLWHPTPLSITSLLKCSLSWPDGTSGAWFSSCFLSSFSWFPMCGPFSYLPV